MLDYLKFWRFHRHPVQRWIPDIVDVLRKLPTDDAVLVDAPCGDGIVTYWLIKKRVGRKFELYDFSEHVISRARKMLDWNKAKPVDLTVEVRDIHSVPLEGRTDDIWLFINSLFLLPDIDRMMERMRSRAKTIIAVFPNTASYNYQQFVAHTPDMNINEMNVDDTVAFFKKHGYRLEEKRDIDCIPLNYFKSKYSKIAVCYLCNPIEPFLPFGKEPCYWLAHFTRDDAPKLPT